MYARPEFQGSFDAVVTCFFIDTAHNILEYLEVIHGVLKPGGIWIHLGPLLWHWAEGGSWEDLSVELSLADVQATAQLMGFELLQKQFVEAAYIGESAGWRRLRGRAAVSKCLCACAAARRGTCSRKQAPPAAGRAHFLRLRNQLGHAV